MKLRGILMYCVHWRKKLLHKACVNVCVGLVWKAPQRERVRERQRDREKEHKEERHSPRQEIYQAGVNLWTEEE